MENNPQWHLFSIRIGGIGGIPDFSTASKRAFAARVRCLLEDPAGYKVMGQKPGAHQKLMALTDPEQLNQILASGGQVCVYYYN